jgi:hypothetical protein
MRPRRTPDHFNGGLATLAMEPADHNDWTTRGAGRQAGTAQLLRNGYGWYPSSQCEEERSLSP